MFASPTQVAQSVPFDNTGTSLISQDVQAAIIELLNTTIGVTFSYKLIQTGETVVIPLNREMVVANYITILGTLNIQGDLSIL